MKKTNNFISFQDNKKILENSRVRELLGSMGAIMLRTSLFNLGVQVSLHPAFDVLSFRVCSCVCSYGMTHVLLRGFAISSCYDFRLHDVDVLSLRKLV